MEEKLDIYIRAKDDGDISKADNEAIAAMEEKARAYKAAENGGRRLRIHLILHNHLLASTLRRLPLNESLVHDIELYTYTHEDLCSMNALGIKPGSTPLLVREKVGYESNKNVHLVIFGAGRQAESLAIHAALTCHLPNYCRDSNLRTRITWFADTSDEFQLFQNHYSNLLEHCYRRYVDISGKEIEISITPPLHAGNQTDFVDIEWEFVTGKNSNLAAQHKLQRWSNDADRMLTIAFCYDDNSRNLNEAMSQTGRVRKNCKILVKSNDTAAIDSISHSSGYANIIPFGCNEAQMYELGDYILMAQYINFAYCSMRATTDDERKNGATEIAVATDIPTIDEIEAAWNNSKLPTAKLWSNIYNSFSLNIKMQTLGIPAQRWCSLFCISDRECEIMTQVEHNRWCIEELILGYSHTTQEQHEAVIENPAMRETLKAMFIHDDLRHFSELGNDTCGLPVERYDRGLTRMLPLIAHAYHTMKTGKP